MHFHEGTILATAKVKSLLSAIPRRRTTTNQKQHQQQQQQRNKQTKKHIPRTILYLTSVVSVFWNFVISIQNSHTTPFMEYVLTLRYFVIAT